MVNYMKKPIAILLALALILSLVACHKPEETSPTEPSQSAETYTVTVRSQGGMALAGIQVYVYADSMLTDLVAFGETDENGVASFAIRQSDTYVAVIASVPKGYTFEEQYTFAGNQLSIVLASGLITDENLSAVQLGVGDVMVDFSVALPDGSELKLSQLLEDKDAVLLNFFLISRKHGVLSSGSPYVRSRSFSLY
jgi:ABC-type Fe3+-hydroxamate transport system substrate-binding protein